MTFFHLRLFHPWNSQQSQYCYMGFGQLLGSTPQHFWKCWDLGWIYACFHICFRYWKGGSCLSILCSIRLCKGISSFDEYLLGLAFGGQWAFCGCSIWFWRRCEVLGRKHRIHSYLKQFWGIDADFRWCLGWFRELFAHTLLKRRLGLWRVVRMEDLGTEECAYRRKHLPCSYEY